MPRDTNGKATKPETAMDDAGMAHMERTKAEKKEIEKGYAVQESGPDYPYGLRIHLDHDGLKKVGIEEMPEVGGEVHIRAKAHVVGARSEKREGGEERHLELQITHLGVHPEEKEAGEKKDNSTSGRRRH